MRSYFFFFGPFLPPAVFFAFAAGFDPAFFFFFFFPNTEAQLSLYSLLGPLRKMVIWVALR